MAKDKGVLIKEDDKYYRAALDPVFAALYTPAYVTVGRWSYIRNEQENPLVFEVGGVGGMTMRSTEFLDLQFKSDAYRKATRQFSFSKLLADNDREIWFHFSNENVPEEGEAQVYLGVSDTKDRNPIIHVAAWYPTPELVNQIIEGFETGVKRYDRNALAKAERGTFGQKAAPDQPIYGQEPLAAKADEMKNTLDAIFSVLYKPDSPVRHISFMPVPIPMAAKRVLGIISICSREYVRVAQLGPVLQPFAVGIMAPFHMQEIDERRKSFALRSAIAAIMSRNMSHNIGSHVLWHLSQELRPH
ncbi:MAG: hypothetical protein ACXW3C_08000 [Pyrinomonadaceae bacterium]